MLDNIRIVLVNTSHPGNIGGVARAMKNMGLSELYLIEPEIFPHGKATARAAGADDILAKAAVVSDLQTALTGCEVVYGTSARHRAVSRPLCMPREAAERIHQSGNKKTAIVFGRENSGLTNDELACCHYHIHIPTNEDYSSLNLAAAVQVIVYEMRIQSLADSVNLPEEQRDLATADEMLGFYDHLREALLAIKFLHPQQGKKMMSRLKHLFYRAEPDKTELNILRGMLSAISKFTKN